MQLPALTREQMREVDRVMIEDLGIGLSQMMENAGRNLADLAVELFTPRSVAVLCGSGGNGGGGMVAARHLSNRGVEVSVTITRESPGGVPGRQLSILRSMGVPVGEPSSADLLIDAVIGYSLNGAPAGRGASLINWAEEQEAPVLALDVPSGVDVDTGEAPGVAVHATATMTLALPKVGLAGSEFTGDLYAADVSVPPTVYERLGLEVGPIFSGGAIVRLD